MPVFSPISSTEILIMKHYDISIFDTKSNTIEKVGTNSFDLLCNNNNYAMSRPNFVVALVADRSIKRLKAISFSKEKSVVSEIKDFGCYLQY